MYYGLVETKDNTIQEDVDKVVVYHSGIDIESINILQVFLDSTCSFEITYLVESPVWLIIVAIVFPNGILDFFPAIVLVSVSFHYSNTSPSIHRLT